ncbi:unnamed protein product [Hermetia illucens]|uniref:Oligopeptide transporter 1 n=1 Tax=Hermetia illucens TaxID=343691 RepID=A0A7R8YXY0_HERIL|nr:peptide transporter family 1-like isoform X2 [Hermetia illucens]CAD7089903.1 unnamed protein product [Hermetia illucens]
MTGHSLKIDEKPAPIKYPKAVGFIISNEFCERFNYYGMRTILVLYLTRKLSYDDDTATVLYHVFTSLVYFFPLIGAIVADSWLGRFRTIFYLSVVYCIGTVIISIGAIPPLNLPVNLVTILGLVLIAVGTGGIKPCVSAFGGDQFKIPEQVKQLATFFSLFYFAINAGSLISTSITPILREDVHCFAENDCFSLAFGIPAVLMVLSIIIFMLGKSMYIIKKPAGNMIVSVWQCITEALRKRSQEKRIAPREHWLDYAEHRYGRKLVDDTKDLLKILVLYLPLPVFWALFDQQGSRWTFQATRMVGDIGGYQIKPDQMQVVNPLLILAFIPVFDYGIYPMLEKIGIKRPLQKLTLGGLLAALAFILSGIVELNLERTYPLLPGHNEGQLRIFNVMPCSYTFNTSLPDYTNFTVDKMTTFTEKHFVLNQTESFDYEAYSDNPELCSNLQGQINLKPETAMSYFVTRNNDKASVEEYRDSPEKPKKIYPIVRVLATLSEYAPLQLKGLQNDVTLNTSSTQLVEVAADTYELYMHGKKVHKITFELGGVYVLMVEGDKTNGYSFSHYVLTEPNSIHMLWQLPQYIVITAGEVMFSVTGLEFSFTQAPASMKSVLQACWLLTVAIGNLIVVAIAEFRMIDSQSTEFFLFAVLMIIDMGIFILLAMRYKYSQPRDDYDTTDLTSQIADSKSSRADRFDKVEAQTSSTTTNGHANPAYEKD